MQEGFPLTNAWMNELQAEYEAYNEKCVNDLKEMNQTKITNIIEKGGVEGWHDGDNLDALTKSFEFDTFEHANAFIQEVGKFCEQKDHHPEWSSSNGGRTLHVRLTSHFANNKVTLFDFELAQNMNKQYTANKKFNMYPRFTEKQFASAVIGGASFVVLMGSYIWLRNNRKITDIALLTSNVLPTEQLPGESDENHAAFFKPGQNVLYTQKKLLP